MALTDVHPSYSEYNADWEQCRDSYRGERAVKKKGRTYLLPTSGQIADGMNSPTDAGYKAYQNYLSRAVFPTYFSDAVENYIGLMWSKPPKIELPAVLEPLLEKATTQNESLEQLLRRINEQQLVVGRCGLLLDLPTNPDPAQPLPYIALYFAEKIRNWDDGNSGDTTIDNLNLVVLDETHQARKDQFSWQIVQSHRVLVLGDVVANEEEGTATYKTGLFTETTTFSPLDMVEPQIRGKKLEKIPFVFVNSKDNIAAPDDPPLMSLSEICMTIYRGEADYRQNLFMQGQDTLVVIGNTQEQNEGEAQRVGAGASLNVPMGGDAKYIGVNSQGLPEQRQALENDKQLAALKAGTIIDIKSGQKEASDTLQTRIAAQTATLNQIALSGAQALEKILKIAAEWMGANPDEVKVTPNLDFANLQMEGQNLVQMMTAKKLGAPLSLESIHQLMVSRNLTTKTFEEEQGLIEEENPLPGTGTDAGGDMNADQNI